jgi:DNA-binding NarL/FixJ family response regulator
MKVLIVDEHTLFAESLALVLRQSGIETIRLADDAGALQEQFSRSAPDVVVIDSELQSRPVGELIHSLAEDRAGTRVIITTGDSGGRARKNGCRRISKDMPLADLLDVIHHDKEPTRPGKSQANGALLQRGKAAVHTYRITPRERQILGLLMAGLGRDEIAEQLGISSNTVRSHIQRTLVKLDSRSRAEAVVTAVKLNLLPIERAL